jgi:hypothetical protein
MVAGPDPERIRIPKLQNNTDPDPSVKISVPDPLVRGLDPDPAPDLSIIKQK